MSAMQCVLAVVFEERCPSCGRAMTMVPSPSDELAIYYASKHGSLLWCGEAWRYDKNNQLVRT